MIKKNRFTENKDKIQIIRYLIVAGSMCIFEYFILYILVDVLVFTNIDAYYLNCGISFALYYCAYSIWVFRVKENKLIRTVKYFIFYVIKTFLYSFIYYLFTELLNIHYIISYMILDVVIFIVNYIVNTNIIFTDKKDDRKWR